MVKFEVRRPGIFVVFVMLLALAAVRYTKSVAAAVMRMFMASLRREDERRRC